MSDPARWSEELHLVKSDLTTDAWDFAHSPEGWEIKPETNENEPVDIMHGDNSHMYAACRTLANMRGYGNWLVDLREESTVASAVLAKMEKSWFGYSTKVFESAAGKLNIFVMADDYGMQDRTVVSPECWRRMFRPRVGRFMDWAHSRGVVTLLHSCGSARSIIPDLIECRVDILDPIQPPAAGMDPFELKREGSDPCFDAAVDIQYLVTRDFVRFQDLGEAIPRGHPDSQDVYVYTGSVIERDGTFYDLLHRPQTRPFGALRGPCGRC